MFVIIILTDREFTNTKFIGKTLTTDSSIDLSSMEAMIESVKKLDLATTLAIVDPVWFKQKLSEHPDSNVKTLADLVYLLPSTTKDFTGLTNYHTNTDNWYTGNNIEVGKVINLRANLDNMTAKEIKGSFIVAISYTSVKPYMEFNHILAKEYGFRLMLTFNYEGSIEENDLTCQSILLGDDLAQSLEQVDIADINDTVELYLVEDFNYRTVEPKSATDTIIDMLKQSGIFG